MEWTLRPGEKSLNGVSLAGPLGKTKSSLRSVICGAVPPQLPGSLQLLVPPRPVHVKVGVTRSSRDSRLSRRRVRRVTIRGARANHALSQRRQLNVAIAWCSDGE